MIRNRSTLAPFKKTVVRYAYNNALSFLNVNWAFARKDKSRSLLVLKSKWRRYRDLYFINHNPLVYLMNKSIRLSTAFFRNEHKIAMAAMAFVSNHYVSLKPLLRRRNVLDFVYVTFLYRRYLCRYSNLVITPALASTMLVNLRHGLVSSDLVLEEVAKYNSQTYYPGTLTAGYSPHIVKILGAALLSLYLAHAVEMYKSQILLAAFQL